MNNARRDEEWLAYNRPDSFDIVDRPSHYTEGRKFEPIDVIQDWELSFLLGNVVKYISRAGRKGDDKELQDLKKARFYLQRQIDQLEESDIPFSFGFEEYADDIWNAEREYWQTQSVTHEDVITFFDNAPSEFEE